jgi:hypothetical protein
VPDIVQLPRTRRFLRRSTADAYLALGSAGPLDLPSDLVSASLRVLWSG